MIYNRTDTYKPSAKSNYESRKSADDFFVTKLVKLDAHQVRFLINENRKSAAKQSENYPRSLHGQGTK